MHVIFRGFEELVVANAAIVVVVVVVRRRQNAFKDSPVSQPRIFQSDGDMSLFNVPANMLQSARPIVESCVAIGTAQHSGRRVPRGHVAGFAGELHFLLEGLMGGGDGDLAVDVEHQGPGVGVWLGRVVVAAQMRHEEILAVEEMHVFAVAQTGEVFATDANVTEILFHFEMLRVDVSFPFVLAFEELIAAIW